MKYKDLIKRFEPYADEEVSIVMSYGDVCFFPVSDGNTCIIELYNEDKEPYRAYEADE